MENFDGEVMYTNLVAAQLRGAYLLVSTSVVMTQGRDNRKVDHNKMARDYEDVSKTSLNTLLEVTEKSGNLRKDLRDDIMKSVSSLRGIYSTIMADLEEKTRKIALRAK